MAVWKLKSCPRCSGDLFIQRETDGWYEECLLCGYQRDVSDIVSKTAGGQIVVKGQVQNKGLYTVRPSVN
jgi:ribosomal protein S27AE